MVSIGLFPARLSCESGYGVSLLQAISSIRLRLRGDGLQFEALLLLAMQFGQLFFTVSGFEVAKHYLFVPGNYLFG